MTGRQRLPGEPRGPCLGRGSPRVPARSESLSVALDVVGAFGQRCCSRVQRGRKGLLSKSLLLSPVLKLSIELCLCRPRLRRRPRPSTREGRRAVAILVQDSTVRWPGLRTAYLCISLSSCRQLLSGKRSARSAVHGGARAPARNTTTLSRIPWVSARGVERVELREWLHHVRVQVGLLEQKPWVRSSCVPHLSL